MGLTEKQQRFADEYIRCGNAAEAARLAGYSKKTARQIGTENLAKPDIEAYIEETLAKIESERIMNATEALELLTKIARGEIKEKVIISFADSYEIVEKEPDINHRKDAAKEILKRYPSSLAIQRRLITAQAEKMEAEASILKNRANKITQNQTARIRIDDLIDLGTGLGVEEEKDPESEGDPDDVV
ncbi:terminase small subunit [Listeria newyorkensis]|uniref:terminase small subunit n=1 Tax=Listeria newyorkensis TaxID=1497681 RepID=UPI00051D81F5|nr:terminase small subunit [Listeria newyorkensis]KGL44495.1 hypothetical protein EP56_07800 [Listeriaceae bacterium FSL A5-0209]KGL45694.1 hypothetical protein EP58_03100 [Listeria newyorkensis]SQC55376.1 Terminase small subunit [Listeria newyorkensis]